MNILITGGTSGIGEAAVKKLAGNNSNTIYFTYSKNLASAENFLRSYSNTKAFKCDFQKESSVRNLIDAIGGWNLDVLINNAYVGSSQGLHFHKQEPVDFLDSFLMNIMPVIQVTQKTLETFRKKKAGKIINILTAALINVPPAGYSIYAANKAYLQQLSKSWSKEYVRFGITSNCISPNFMETHLTQNTDARIIEQMIAEHPLKKLLSPDEVADCVNFLVNAPTQVNGVNIVVNAGMSMI